MSEATDPQAMRIKQIKEELTAEHVPHTDAFEKADLIQRLIDARTAGPPKQPPPSAKASAEAAAPGGEPERSAMGHGWEVRAARRRAVLSKTHGTRHRSGALAAWADRAAARLLLTSRGATALRASATTFTTRATPTLGGRTAVGPLHPLRRRGLPPVVVARRRATTKRTLRTSGRRMWARGWDRAWDRASRGWASRGCAAGLSQSTTIATAHRQTTTIAASRSTVPSPHAGYTPSRRDPYAGRREKEYEQFKQEQQKAEVVDPVEPSPYVPPPGSVREVQNIPRERVRAPSVDEARRNRSPGISNNFYDINADFKRPYGMETTTRTASAIDDPPGREGNLPPDRGAARGHYTISPEEPMKGREKEYEEYKKATSGESLFETEEPLSEEAAEGQQQTPPEDQPMPEQQMEMPYGGADRHSRPAAARQRGRPVPWMGSSHARARNARLWRRRGPAWPSGREPTKRHGVVAIAYSAEGRDDRRSAVDDRVDANADRYT